MSKYVYLEKNTNKILGWYDDSINKVIPEGSITVTDQVWKDAININANAYVKGSFVVKDFRTSEGIFKDVKENKKQELQTKFNKVSLEPVLVNGISYYGGYESSQKLDAKRRLIVESGGTEITYFDTDRKYHTHTLKEALNVCVVIAIKYETDLEYYNTKLKEVEICKTIEEVKGIIY